MDADLKVGQEKAHLITFTVIVTASNDVMDQAAELGTAPVAYVNSLELNQQK